MFGVDDLAVMYIEFIGPPGSGKTTLHKRLTNDDKYYGGYWGNAVVREFRRDTKYHHLLRFLPGDIQRKISEHFLDPRYTKKSFYKFLMSNPRYIKIAEESLSTDIYQHESIIKLWGKAAERYQISFDSKDDDEVLCLDEVFCMLACSISWRTDDNKLPISDFFDIVPLPDYLIYVDAPKRICLKRQRERGYLAVQEPWVQDIETAQNNFKHACDVVSDMCQSYETRIVNVENTMGVEKAEMEIRSKLA